MTEELRQIIIRHSLDNTYHLDGKQHPGENPEAVLTKINDLLGFDIQAQPEKIAAVLEDAIHSENEEDIHCALHLARIVNFQPVFLPLLIRILDLSWHYDHEDLVTWFQGLKAPETVEVLYRTAFTQHPTRAWDDYGSLARKCIWALADIGTAEAFAKLQAMAQCDISYVAEFAQKRLDKWQDEFPRKGTLPVNFYKDI